MLKLEGPIMLHEQTNSCISPTEECFQDLYTGPL